MRTAEQRDENLEVALVAQTAESLEATSVGSLDGESVAKRVAWSVAWRDVMWVAAKVGQMAVLLAALLANE